MPQLESSAQTNACLFSELVQVVPAQGRLVDDPLQAEDGLPPLLDLLGQLLGDDVRVHLRLLLDLVQQRFRSGAEAGLPDLLQLERRTIVF